MPDWVSNLPNEEFPQELFFRDIGISNKSFDDAKKKALTSIAKQIESDVKAKSTLKKKSVIWNKRETIEEEYSDNSMIFTVIDLKNAELSKQVEEDSVFYALVTIDKEILVQTLRNEVSIINKNITSNIESAEKNFQNNRINMGISDLLSVNELVWSGEDLLNLISHIVVLNENDKLSIDTKKVDQLLLKYLGDIKLTKISGDDQNVRVGEKLEDFKISLKDKNGTPLQKVAIIVDKGLDDKATVYTDENGIASFSFRSTDTGDFYRYINVKVSFPFSQKIMRKIEDNLSVDFKYKSIPIEKVYYTIKMKSPEKSSDKLLAIFESKFSKIGIQNQNKNANKIVIDVKSRTLSEIVSMGRFIQKEVVVTISILNGKKHIGSFEMKSKGFGSDDSEALVSAVSNVDLDYEKLANLLGLVSINEKLPSLAIANFNENSIFSENIALTFTNMVESAFYESDEYDIVERKKFDEIIKEFVISSSGLASKENAVKAGEIVSADFLVVGNISRISGKYEIDARLIEVRTSKVIKMYNTKAYRLSELRYCAKEILDKLTN